MTSEAVRAFREDYRREHLPRHYRGWVHLVFTFGIGGCAFAWCVTQLEQVRPVEWLTLPLTFLYANLAEYWGHRGPMHHLKPRLRLAVRDFEAELKRCQWSDRSGLRVKPDRSDH